jgi:predicted house-cleaning noncanonical NTP pyrophosphatase (MazG superfamily)
VRVLYRLGMIPQLDEDQAIAAARRMHSAYPGQIDGALWTLGREVCASEAPACGRCRLVDLCAYAHDHHAVGAHGYPVDSAESTVAGRRTQHNKLVRDRIPDIIRAQGQQCATTILDDEQYRRALHAKLIEEATELAQAPREELLTELADVREVLDALIFYYRISEPALAGEQKKRRDERGGFLKRINLVWAG